MIDTKTLRKKVLDLAMRGKLVSQDSNDEPASELLKRIKAEKEELIKQKKIKRDKNETEIFKCADGLYYEKFADGTIKEVDVPYELPQGWEWSRIASATKKIVAGGDKPNEVSFEKTSEFQIPIYSNGVKDNGLYGWAKEAKIIEPSVTVSARGTIGFTVIRSRPFVPIVRLISVTPLEKTVDVSFLKYILSYLIPTGEGTSIPQLTVPGLKPFLIALPPYSEQLRITESIQSYLQIIDEIDNNQAELNNLANQLKRKVLDVAMQGKLVPQDPNDEPTSVLLEKIRAEKLNLFKEGKLKKKDLVENELVKDNDNDYYEKLPNSWALQPIQNVYWNLGQKKPRSLFRYIDTSSIDNKSQKIVSTLQISREKAPSRARKVVQKDSVLFSTVRSYLLNSAIVKDTNTEDLIASTAFVVLDSLMDSNFLLSYLISPHTIAKVSELSTGTNYPAINEKNFNSLAIPVPPIDEQIRISSLISSVKRLLQKLV
ncbi:restriction endonuclease subunit S [Enterococcus dispar]|uniref:restriction endonuclease subunit S n=1 Tax=Enterococcus dispar TaxID=44009 RepID=UPI002490F39C|nr:restriction endonuclease subunit S [Enterococcus dispar]